MLIVPAIDIRGGRVVRLAQGDFAEETLYNDAPVKVARRWEGEGA
ncbi:1-(5-phosphoribosyl)-5-((5-phosphoribosylamino)methylideneamino)imidazole-4-carboxamide isomerase, partial [bacterium]|nr:1-(5-phosphoribosyl)-5-((5-phosphoribosylamino)methylideneamino)imidazole-4-carboxamide isomerase [bacterium]